MIQNNHLTRNSQMSQPTVSRRLFSSRRAAGLGVVVLALLLIVACDSGPPSGSPTLVSRGGGIELRLWLDPDPPRLDSRLWIEVADAQGAAVEDAELSVGFSMSAMGAMAEMRGDVAVTERRTGTFRAALALPVAGTWTLPIAVRVRSQEVLRAEYQLQVGVAGLREVSVSGSAPEAAEREGALVVGAAGDDVAYYTCSMHTSVRSAEPGKCPICSMDLVPVHRHDVETNTFVVDEKRRQEIGVRTAPVGRERFSAAIRAPGRVAYDESLESEVTVKIQGFITTLRVDQTGQRVSKGQVLFDLYSPDLHATQQELLVALDSQRRARDTGAADRADYLVLAAKERLRLWDLDRDQIDEIARSGVLLESLPIRSPAAGYVIDKQVVAGSAVMPGQTLYRLAGIDRVWVEADVYEAELPLVKVGQPATVTLSYLPGKSFAGRVSFIYPYLTPETRTGKVRVTLANPGETLKPEMYANVELAADLGERLAVPVEAVLFAGDRRLVFVDLGKGRLAPREIVLGVRSGERYEVLSGLEPGEVVVTSGNFLVAAESRLKSVLEKW